MAVSTAPPDASTTASTSTLASSSTTATTTTTTTATTTTTTTVPLVPVEFGRSVQGRPLVAFRRGTPGGVKVLVIGVIHGDEDAGLAIIDQLGRVEVPDGIELWWIPAINPDGVALQQRQNANGVDLNRNFPYNWGPIAEPGDWEFAGSVAASEPETQATVAFVSALNPALTVWYHQDYNRIAPADGLDGLVRARYAQLVGLPLLSISGGTYTGVAATWVRRGLGALSFIVELGPGELSAEQAATHAAAVVDVAQVVRDSGALAGGG